MEIEELAKPINEEQHKDPTKPTAAQSLSLVIFLLFTPVLCLFTGWGLWLMWNWFSIPPLPIITWHQAVGLSLLIGYVKIKRVDLHPDKDGTYEPWRHMLLLVVGILIAVGLGWIMHSAFGFGNHPVEVVLPV